MEINKYQKALDWLKTRENWNGMCFEELQVDIRYDEKFKTLQELIDICSKPNSIKQKLDHIQDVIDCCYETDDKGKQIDNGWNNDVDCANEYLWDIKQAYSFRVEDTRIVNELSELLGCNVDNITKRVKQLEKALDKACGILSDSNSTLAPNQPNFAEAENWKEYLLKEEQDV